MNKTKITLLILVLFTSSFSYSDDLKLCKMQTPPSLEPCKRLALNNDPDGLFGLGMLILDGIGVRQDYKLSFDLMYKSAMQGHAGAQLQVGQAYVNGQGVKRDFEEEYSWLLVSRENGNPIAQQGIDSMNQNGIIKRDRLRAVTQRANVIYSELSKKSGYKYDKNESTMPVSGLTEYCDMVMPTVDSIINLRKYGKPKSSAHQLIIGMTDSRAINMMNGVIDWVWISNIPVNDMSQSFRSKCLSQSKEISFMFQQ